MKKKLMMIGLFAMAAVVLGAITVQKTVIEPRTIFSWSDLLAEYLEYRSTVPPIPSPVSYEEVLKSIEHDDWSFLREKYWKFNCNGGVHYVDDKSELAKQLTLPLHIMIYEDMRRGEIVILSSPDGSIYKGEALFGAPEFMPYEKYFPLQEYLRDEFDPRRIIWHTELKSESSAWADILAQSTAASLEEEPFDSMMMRSSAPPAHTNDIWLQLEDQTNGNIQVQVFAPDQYTNIEVFSAGSLLSNRWSLIATNQNPAGPTNPEYIA